MAEPATHAEDAGALPHQHGRLRVRGAGARHPPHPQHRNRLLKPRPCPAPACARLPPHPPPRPHFGAWAAAAWSLRAGGRGVHPGSGTLTAPVSACCPLGSSPGQSTLGTHFPAQGYVGASALGHRRPSASVPMWPGASARAGPAPSPALGAQQPGSPCRRVGT